MKRSPIKRGTKKLKQTKPLRRTSSLKSTGRIKTVGKKTQQWIDTRVELVQEFLRMGITSCELGYEGCWRTEALGFAHSQQRSQHPEMYSNEKLREVILACTPCHNKIEGKKDMEQIVCDVIRQRNQRLRRFKPICS